MLGAKPMYSPCTSGSKLSRHDGEALSDPTAYCQLVGSLQYCTLRCPNIAFSVNQLCQHMHSSTTLHWIAAKRVLRHLKHTFDHGLIYSKSPLHVQAFTGFDWAADPNDRRSTSSFGVFLGNCLACLLECQEASCSFSV